MNQRVTLTRVNAAIKDLGYELVKGSGYFYFWPLDNAKQLYDDSVFTRTLSAFTVEEWRKELVYKLEDYHNL